MEFKIGDKVRYRMSGEPYEKGVITKKCPVSMNCRVVRHTATGKIYHIYFRDLILDNKNLQLEFKFMEEK